MNIRRIKYFIMVAEQQHFGRAAKLLHISQPPLSQQIRMLEKDLGMELFTRTTRRVDLTDAGRALLQSCKKAVEDLEQAVAYAQLVHRGEGGVLRLGFVSTAAVKLLPEALRQFRHRYPKAQIECFHLTSEQQADALENGTIDAGFLRTLPKGNFEWKVIQRERLFVALASGHPLSRIRKIQISALSSEPFVMWDKRQTAGMASTVVGLCRKHGFDPLVALEVTNPQALISLVANGLGVAIVPESALHTKHENVVFKPLQVSAAYSELSLAWRKDNRREFLQRFVSVVGGMSEMRLTRTKARHAKTKRPMNE